MIPLGALAAALKTPNIWENPFLHDSLGAMAALLPQRTGRPENHASLWK